MTAAKKPRGRPRKKKAEPARPAHSPLGASGAERWMNCPGSVALLKELDLPQSDEPDYRKEGTAAHAALEQCLTNDADAWEVVGREFEGVKVSVEMADAIQVFIDTVRPSFEGAKERFIERGIDCPDFHPLFYGTVDCGVLWHGTWSVEVSPDALEDMILPSVDPPLVEGDILDVNDFKYGQGVVVEVEWNPQVMYYAYGLIRQLSLHRNSRVRLRIVQPRGFHTDGPVREWVTDAGTIIDWAEGKLKPAMERAETEKSFMAGDWCRFCPAKLACPLMVGLFEAAATHDPKRIPDLSDQALGNSYSLRDAVKHYLKAMEDEAFRRLNAGHEITEIKLVHKKANRVWKDNAESVLKEHFGDKIYTDPTMKSPAQIQALGGLAKELVPEYAYTPESGLTVALASDSRVAVKIKPAEETFATALKGLKP